MNKYVGWYIFCIGAFTCVSLYEIREAYKEGLKDGKKIGKIAGISEVIGTIHDKWSVLRETDNKDPLEWLDAVVETAETFSDITEKKEEKTNPDDEARKEFMKAAAEAQERLMTS